MIDREGLEAALEDIRPFLNKDGGDVEIVSFDEEEVRVRFLGMCSMCNINQSTLKNGIESQIKKNYPHIKRVINIEEI